jgi:hypothetical protein
VDVEGKSSCSRTERPEFAESICFRVRKVPICVHPLVQILKSVACLLIQETEIQMGWMDAQVLVKVLVSVHIDSRYELNQKCL